MQLELGPGVQESVINTCIQRGYIVQAVIGWKVRIEMAKGITIFMQLLPNPH